MAGLFQARWSSRVHEEWMRAVLRDRSDLSFVRLDSARAAMDDHAEDCLVTGFEPLIDSLTLPDPEDRHVLAAAIVAEADVVVTYNLRDFPADALDRYKIEARHPDEFVSRLIDLAPTVAVDVVRAQRASLKDPPLDMDQLLAIFERIGLAKTVAALRQLGV